MFCAVKNLRPLDVGGVTIGELEKQGRIKTHALFYDVKTGKLSNRPKLLRKFGLLKAVENEFS